MILHESTTFVESDTLMTCVDYGVPIPEMMDGVELSTDSHVNIYSNVVVEGGVSLYYQFLRFAALS